MRGLPGKGGLMMIIKEMMGDEGGGGGEGKGSVMYENI